MRRGARGWIAKEGRVQIVNILSRLWFSSPASGHHGLRTHDGASRDQRGQAAAGTVEKA
jgi:hypothetical protein